jgi:hypothetical protein
MHPLTANVGQQNLRTRSTGSGSSSSAAAVNHPVPIHSAADVRRLSSGSGIEMGDVDASILAAAGGDGHVPYLLCE